MKYNLTPAWLQITHEVAQALSARLILGINLEARSRRIAVAEARVFLAGLGRRQIAGLEIGNEPELYGALGWYKSAAGRQIRGRPHGYDFAAFVREFSAIARATRMSRSRDRAVVRRPGSRSLEAFSPPSRRSSLPRCTAIRSSIAAART